MSKIDINKTYRTRDGHEVKLFTTEGRDRQYPVIGEILREDGKWTSETWTQEGNFNYHCHTGGFDLIKVVKKWRGEIWVHAVGESFSCPTFNEDQATRLGWRKITVEEVEVES